MGDHGSDRLALQYGAAHFLEEMVFVPPPDQTLFPKRCLRLMTSDALNVRHKPDMERRGIHLHTLHPIEGYFDFWEPGEDNVLGAERIIDWLIKNRGNYLQWVALNDIVGSESGANAWAGHNQAILDYAKKRGIQTGIGVQLYGGLIYNKPMI